MVLVAALSRHAPAACSQMHPNGWIVLSSMPSCGITGGFKAWHLPAAAPGRTSITTAPVRCSLEAWALLHPRGQQARAHAAVKAHGVMAAEGQGAEGLQQPFQQQQQQQEVLNGVENGSASSFSSHSVSSNGGNSSSREESMTCSPASNNGATRGRRGLKGSTGSKAGSGSTSQEVVADARLPAARKAAADDRAQRLDRDKRVTKNLCSQDTLPGLLACISLHVQEEGGLNATHAAAAITRCAHLAGRLPSMQARSHGNSASNTGISKGGKGGAAPRQAVDALQGVLSVLHPLAQQQAASFSLREASNILWALGRLSAAVPATIAAWAAPGPQARAGSAHGSTAGQESLVGLLCTQLGSRPEQLQLADAAQSLWALSQIPGPQASKAAWAEALSQAASQRMLELAKAGSGAEGAEGAEQGAAATSSPPKNSTGGSKRSAPGGSSSKSSTSLASSPEATAAAAAQNLATMAYALAKLGASPQPAWLRLHCRAMQRVCHAAEDQALANLLWAYARLGLSCGAPEGRWLRRMCCTAVGQAGSMSPQGLANTVWALGQLGYRLGAPAAASASAPEASDAEVAPRASQGTPGKAGLLAAAVSAALPSMTLSGVLQVLHGLALLDSQQPEVQSLVPRLVYCKVLLSPRRPRTAAASLRKSIAAQPRQQTSQQAAQAGQQHQGPQAGSAAGEEVGQGQDLDQQQIPQQQQQALQGSLEHLSPQELCNLMWALAQLRYRPARAWTAAYFHAVEQHASAALAQQPQEPVESWLVAGESECRGAAAAGAGQGRKSGFQVRDVSQLLWAWSTLPLVPPDGLVELLLHSSLPSLQQELLWAQQGSAGGQRSSGGPRGGPAGRVQRTASEAAFCLWRAVMARVQLPFPWLDAAVGLISCACEQVVVEAAERQGRQGHGRQGPGQSWGLDSQVSKLQQKGPEGGKEAAAAAGMEGMGSAAAGRGDGPVAAAGAFKPTAVVRTLWCLSQLQYVPEGTALQPLLAALAAAAKAGGVAGSELATAMLAAAQLQLPVSEGWLAAVCGAIGSQVEARRGSSRSMGGDKRAGQQSHPQAIEDTQDPSGFPKQEDVSGDTAGDGEEGAEGSAGLRGATSSTRHHRTLAVLQEAFYCFQVYMGKGSPAMQPLVDLLLRGEGRTKHMEP